MNAIPAQIAKPTTIDIYPLVGLAIIGASTATSAYLVVLLIRALSNAF